MKHLLKATDAERKDLRSQRVARPNPHFINNSDQSNLAKHVGPMKCLEVRRKNTRLTLKRNSSKFVVFLNSQMLCH